MNEGSRGHADPSNNRRQRASLRGEVWVLSVPVRGTEGGALAVPGVKIKPFRETVLVHKISFIPSSFTRDHLELTCSTDMIKIQQVTIIRREKCK